MQCHRCSGPLVRVVAVDGRRTDALGTAMVVVIVNVHGLRSTAMAIANGLNIVHGLRSTAVVNELGIDGLRRRIVGSPYDSVLWIGTVAVPAIKGQSARGSCIGDHTGPAVEARVDTATSE